MWSAGTLLLSEESEHPVTIVANILVGIVALIHVYIVVLEMVLWKTPRVRAAFGTTEEFAEQSAPLVANQGLYNGFLAAALLWGLIAPDPSGFQFTLYGLICVIVAGLFGAATASRRILFVQVLPGVVALIAVLIAH
ncbi:MAG: putative rane protein [Pseudonocardiales bacterium]|nr:putative rane protein [Pseudonocardiales bacterium]